MRENEQRAGSREQGVKKEERTVKERAMNRERDAALTLGSIPP
jgi:hypothetical protein